MPDEISQGSAAYDFFIAHAGPDVHAAEHLFDLLEGGASVFLDPRSLRPGDDWDRALIAG